MVRGRKPIPSKVQEAKGAFKKNPQRRRDNEPPAPSGVPAMPSDLDALGKKCWRTTVDLIAEMELISKTDWRALEEYCRHYQRWKRLLDLVEENGESLSYTDANRNVRKVRNPDFSALLDAEKQMARFETEYGFSPSSRARLSVPGQKREDQLDALFAARGTRN